MRVRWSKQAQRYLQQVFEFIAKDNFNAAVEIEDSIFTAALKLAEWPQSGRPGEISGVRELVVPGTPYVITYRVDDDEVRLVRLFHGAQDRR